MKYVSCFNKKKYYLSNPGWISSFKSMPKKPFPLLIWTSKLIEVWKERHAHGPNVWFYNLLLFYIYQEHEFYGRLQQWASGYLTRTVFQNIDDSNIQRLKSRILIFEQKRLISRRNWENIHRWDHAYNVHVGWNVGRTIHHSPPSILFGGRVPEPDSEARGGERRTVSPLPNARMSEILASTNNVSELNINGDACRMQKEETMISLLSKAIGW